MSEGGQGAQRRAAVSLGLGFQAVVSFSQWVVWPEPRYLGKVDQCLVSKPSNQLCPKTILKENSFLWKSKYLNFPKGLCLRFDLYCNLVMLLLDAPPTSMAVWICLSFSQNIKLETGQFMMWEFKVYSKGAGEEAGEGGETEVGRAPVLIQLNWDHR